jgi:predicted Zn-dependent peptidase
MEPPNLRGVSHFIEHMCFKGTPTYSKPSDCLYIFDSTGAYFNAYTTQRFTVYLIKCHVNDLGQLLHTLSDGVLNSKFNPDEYRKELKVVVEESIKLLDNNEANADIQTDRLLYAGTPFGYPVDWYEYHKDKHSDLANRAKVMEFYKKWYCPQNMVLSVTGNLSYKNFTQALQRTHFLKGGASNPNAVHEDLRDIKLRSSGPQYYVANINVPKTSYVSIGFRTCTYDSLDKYVLDFIAELFSGFFNSKMFSILREQNGLTYASKASTEYYDCGGDFTLFAVSDIERLFVSKQTGVIPRLVSFVREQKKPGVIPLIVSMVREIKESGPTPDEMRLTKLHLQRSRELVRLSNECASYNGEWILRHPDKDVLVPFPNVYDKYIANITAEQVRDVARKYFIQENLCVCVLGRGVKQDNVKQFCGTI